MIKYHNYSIIIKLLNIIIHNCVKREKHQIDIIKMSFRKKYFNVFNIEHYN